MVKTRDEIKALKLKLLKDERFKRIASYIELAEYEINKMIQKDRIEQIKQKILL